jgi:hypothetical protein
MVDPPSANEICSGLVGRWVIHIPMSNVGARLSLHLDFGGEAATGFGTDVVRFVGIDRSFGKNYCVFSNL